MDVTDILPFFNRPYHVKEEDKNILDRERNEKIVLSRYIKRKFSAYLSPVMLISRKVTKESHN